MPHHGKRARVTGSTKTHFSHCLLLPQLAGCVPFTYQTFSRGHISDIVNRLLVLLFTYPTQTLLPNNLAIWYICFLFCLIRLHITSLFFFSLICFTKFSCGSWGKGPFSLKWLFSGIKACLSPAMAPTLTWSHETQGAGSLSTHLDLTDGPQGSVTLEAKSIIGTEKHCSRSLFHVMHTYMMKVIARGYSTVLRFCAAFTLLW